MMINGSVKRAHEETKVMDNKHLLHQQQQQQQVMVVDAGGENVAAETTTTTMRPSKVARHEREVDVKQGGHHHQQHHHHHHEQLPPPLLPVFHHKREIPSLETMTGGGVREATTSTPLQQQQLQGLESKQQIKFVQQEQQVRQFLEERTDERRIERDAQGSGMPDSSNRGLGQEATTTGGSSNGETLIPDVHPTRKNPPVEHEGKKQLWELQEASGENRVESSFFKEEKEKEAAKEREKKDETLVAAAAVRDRNDRKEEHVVLHHPPILLLEQKGTERDQREKAAAAEKEKEKDKVHGNKDWGRDKGKGMSRDKREKRDKEELKDHQVRFVDQEHTHEKKEDINVAVIKEQELSRTQQPAGDHIESQKASVGKEGQEGEEEKEGEKREDDWDRENKRKRMWESEKDNNRQLGGGGGSPEGGGGTGGEKHRDNRDTVVNHNVQQRARLLRPRQHSSPAAPRDLLRTYPRVKENDAYWHWAVDNAGPLESSALLYRIGEGMPELTMLWKDYEANAATVATESKTIPSQTGFTVEIRIPADLATTSNHQIRGRQLWGTDIYTDDSDIVAVLMHTGYYTPMAIPPPRSVSELQATIRILPPQETYTSMLRNSLRSRAWGGGSGCSYRVELCQIIKACVLIPFFGIFNARNQKSGEFGNIAPTLAPAASERTVTTRAACSNAYLQQRLVREVTIQYNLCNEPWLKYSMSIVADRGLKKSQYTSARLKKGDVLYMETHRHRYGYGVHNGERVYPDSHPPNAEKNGQGHSTRTHNGDSHERYRWSRCLRPLPLSAMRIKGVPSPPDNVEVLQDGLAWEEVKWSPTSVWVRGVEYPLARAQFLSPHVEDSDD
ncbi:unnamed protein product [Sphagnum troendelagicum]|uniref:Histone deacetylation protein Rxt3 n=1 Tax=Sphagnum troendelagicum TaxID=128251 RepID=A0ABP0T860_9BRYO